MAKRTARKAARPRAVPAMHNGHPAHVSADGDPRFEVYVIDSGWKTEAGETLRESMDLFTKYLKDHDVYVLDEDQSENFLQHHPQLLGKDPIVAVLDRAAIERGSSDGIGARLLLGRVHDKNRVQALLKMLLRIVNTRQLAQDLPKAVRQEVHREGVSGAIEVIMETTGHIEAEAGH
jgi:hypothetical protein